MHSALFWVLNPVVELSVQSWSSRPRHFQLEFAACCSCNFGNGNWNGVRNGNWELESGLGLGDRDRDRRPRRSRRRIMLHVAPIVYTIWLGSLTVPAAHSLGLLLHCWFCFCCCCSCCCCYGVAVAVSANQTASISSSRTTSNCQNTGKTDNNSQEPTATCTRNKTTKSCSLPANKSLGCWSVQLGTQNQQKNMKEKKPKKRWTQHNQSQKRRKSFLERVSCIGNIYVASCHCQLAAFNWFRSLNAGSWLYEGQSG